MAATPNVSPCRELVTNFISCKSLTANLRQNSEQDLHSTLCCRPAGGQQYEFRKYPRGNLYESPVPLADTQSHRAPRASTVFAQPGPTPHCAKPNRYSRPLTLRSPQPETAGLSQVPSALLTVQRRQHET